MAPSKHSRGALIGTVCRLEITLARKKFRWEEAAEEEEGGADDLFDTGTLLVEWCRVEADLLKTWWCCGGSGGVRRNSSSGMGPGASFEKTEPSEELVLAVEIIRELLVTTVGAATAVDGTTIELRWERGGDCCCCCCWYCWWFREADLLSITAFEADFERLKRGCEALFRSCCCCCCCCCCLLLKSSSGIGPRFLVYLFIRV